MNDARRLFTLIGLILVFGGVALLVYIALTVFQVINSPSDVPYVRLILDHMRTGDKVAYGHAGAETFEFNVTEPARTVVLIFLGVIVLSIVTGIVKSIITAGISIIRVASTTEETDSRISGGPVSPTARR